ncbi:MAG: glucose-1-phosphate adenylyltransferase [Vicinamibacteria bacterium]|nr:glucose-1-phosphate adenylyltransferase [Vicinamibacteria bacterium]
MRDVISIILGGGRGTRLFPLTMLRSKPAVPVAGKYRLIDIPISNCIHSDVKRIFVLTQFNSQSLNRHISQTYNFDVFSFGFISILAAEQTQDNPDWYQGTADAVRQSLRHLRDHTCRDVLILSGDQLYQMDFQRLIAAHRTHMADATVAVKPVPAEQTLSFGILKTDAQGRIVHFEEKPVPDRLQGLDSLLPGTGPAYLASMGIYVFRRAALERALQDPSLVDFGRHVIPHVMPTMRVNAHVFRGYWEDVGTIGSYFDANMALCIPLPPFDFHNALRPIYTHPRFLPASKIENCVVRNSLLSEGAILIGAEIERSIVGIRARIGRDTTVRDSLLLGADFYETLEEMRAAETDGQPPIGIGAGCLIEGAIIDKNTRIGRGVRIHRKQGVEKDRDGEGYFIRDGIVVVPKGAVIPDGTVI